MPQKKQPCSERMVISIALLLFSQNRIENFFASTRTSTNNEMAEVTNSKFYQGLRLLGMNTVRAFYETCQQESFDPFQVFEIAPEPCHILQISNLHGTNITKGRVGDLMDTPDPYLILQVKNSPNGKKTTRHFNNQINPAWDETFEFYLDPKSQNKLEITLMDANYTVDETLGVQVFDLDQLLLGMKTEMKLNFIGNSEVRATLLLTEDKTPDLRYSLALCDEEKRFLQLRCQKVLHGLRKLLGEKGPETVREVPVIGVLGSGGGFRAMVCLSGVFKALSDTGLLDCVTYVAGLSGSSWYLSTLYSHPDFPMKPAGNMQPELQKHINQNPFTLLSPASLYRYTGAIVNKRLSGQPISFTDFFGHLLGDTLLRNRKDSKLADQQQKIEFGLAPLPLYTCLHVKENVTAKVFQEWLEFSPYEVGIAKYGTFMKTALFGSKMFLGRVVKKYDEYPLHYLQGVWGSAFCILFKQLSQEGRRKDLAQLMREEKDEENEAELDKQLENFMITDDLDKLNSSDEDEGKDGDLPKRRTSAPVFGDKQGKAKKRLPKKMSMETKKKTQTSLWQGIVNNLFTSSWLDTCAGRAGMIHNPLRGLSLNYLYPISPFSPTTPSDDVDFKGSHEALPTQAKKLYLVDGGLTFNSPYPLLLRPQRGVELYLSFDFSARPTDQTPPFKELLLAEKWAKCNNVLFPPIEDQARAYAREPVKECYVFQHPTNSYCPLILHFVIINNKFQTFTAPGVERTTEEEIEFGKFDIFDDPQNPYSLYNFNYSPLEFQRMSKLMEFNTLSSLELIKETIAKTIERKRNTLPKAPISLTDIARLKMRFRTPVASDAFRKLKAYVRHLSREEIKVQQSKEETSDSCAQTPLPEQHETSSSSDEDKPNLQKAFCDPPKNETSVQE